MKKMDMSQARACLAAGGLLIYPTETFYALGCRADRPKAIDLVYQLKGRPANRPLALVAAGVMQAREVICLEDLPGALWQKFWPGPLSIAGRARGRAADPRLAPGGCCALRVSGHEQARRLAADCPITSSSANLSGRAPVSDWRNLDPALLNALAQCGAPWGLLPADPGKDPAGGLPSSLVRVHPVAGGWMLEILREGAVGRRDLENCGFDIIRPDRRI